MECADADEFRRELISETHPPAAESERRLNLAGWILFRHENTFRTGEPDQNTITLTRGTETRTFEGENLNEVFYRATQELLD
jgi:hypothetical protein